LNSVRRRVARFSALALASAGLVIGQMATAPANADEILVDPGFEQSVAGDSPGWEEADSLFGSPLCDSSCSSFGINSAHSGDWWAWFGGAEDAGHTGSLSQDVTIPAEATTLTYWYQDPGGTAPLDATLTVKMDDDVLKTYTETEEGMADYAQETVDITDYADGASHTLSFSYENGPEDGLAAFFVDDVSIQGPDHTAPQTSVTGPPGGIAKSLTVPISFTSSEAGSTFACSLDSGASAPCTSPNTVTVTPGSHTFKVAATDAANNTDATPASVTFTAYDCTSLKAAVTAAQAKVDAADKKVDKAKKALKKAKKSHSDKKVKKAKKKLKKAKAELKAANAALATAQAGAAPCGTTLTAAANGQSLKVAAWR
jgi:flagellin-like hook-associated protein FlgL